MAVRLASHVPKTAPNDGVIDAAKKALGAALIEAREHVGEITLLVQREAIVEVCRARMLIMLTSSASLRRACGEIRRPSASRSVTGSS